MQPPNTKAFRGAAALGVVFLLSRLPWLPMTLADHDAVNFARGLGAFDLTAHAPHFPGYPVFMALAGLVHALGLPEPAALALPGMVVGAATTALLFWTLHRRCGVVAAWLGGGIYAALPGIWLADMTPMSDALGLHIVTLGVLALIADRRLAAAGLVGLLLGVRLSSAPLGAALGLALLWRAEGLRERVALLTVGAMAVLVWLVPLTSLAGGPTALWELGASFVGGHMGTWGHTAWSPGATSDGRLGTMLWNLGAHALGVVGCVVIGAGLLAQARRPGRELTTLALVALPYALWVVLGQNPDKPRHVLPLVPVLLLAAAPGLQRLAEATGRARLVAVAVPVAVVATMVPRLVVVATELPAPLQAVEWVVAHHGPEQLQVYAGDDTGLWRWYAPEWRSVMVRGGADIARDSQERGNRAATVLVTSRAGELDALSATELEVAAHFERSALVDGRRHALTVYRWTGEAAGTGGVR